MREAHFQAAADVLAGWRDDVLAGTPPVLYPTGIGELAKIEIGPRLVTLLGGPPGAGKTAFCMQLVIDALRMTPELRAIVCNVEMPPAVLLDRQLARLSGIDLSLIRHRKLTDEHSGRIDQGLATLEPLCDRLAFVRPPFDLANVAATADAFDASLIVLDYLQRIAPPGDHGDRRGAVDASMSYLRQFADEGVAVIVVAAVARSRDSKGRSSYGEGLNLASFRESSELEFGCDDAFILAPENDSETMTLRHLKSRNGEPQDIVLSFNRRLQRFTEAGPFQPPRSESRKLTASIAALWNRTPRASDDREDREE